VEPFGASEGVGQGVSSEALKAFNQSAKQRCENTKCED
jgi:hypothetical protein